MTTTDYSAPTPPPAGPPPTRVIRRSSHNRVAAGVSGGLGEYFGVDPVLFRVLFAVTAFFGGAGIFAYLIAWAVIPDATTPDAPLDRAIRELRRRHIPFWLVAAVAVFVGWALLFSWWAPVPFFPVIIAVILLVVVLSRRKTAAAAAPPPFDGSPNTATDTATNAAPDSASTDLPPTGPPAPGWVPETQAWIAESRARSRVRRRRAAPVRWITLGVLLITTAILATADAVSGIVIPAYFWTAGGIVLAGLVVGMILRRTPWTLSLLLIPTIIALIGFGGTRASLHDGAGKRIWSPTSATELDSSYRLAFGQGTLDLRHVQLDAPQHVSITMAAGQVRILVPSDLNVRVHATIHIGTIERDGQTDFRAGRGDAAGYDIDMDVPNPTPVSGPELTVDVHLADGNVSVEHV